MLLGKKIIGTIAYLGGLMNVPEPFCWSWSQMIQYNNSYIVQPNEAIQYYRSTVSLHSFARNDIVNRSKGDWVLMMDADHQFEPDIAVRMLSLMEKYKIDVLTGIYVFKGDPHPPVLYGWDKKKKKFYPLGKWKGVGEIFEVGSAGGGCLMVRWSVFERIKEELKEEPFSHIGDYGEDHSFFLRLKKLGIKVYAATNIQSKHLSYQALGLEDYDQSKVSFSPWKKNIETKK